LEKYEKIRMVGRGAFGTVYQYERKVDKKPVVIKQIPVENFTQEERQTTLNEGEVLSMLNHPNIVEYYESFIEEQAIIIVMEYVPGGTLLEFLQQRKNNLLGEKEILHLFAQLVLALHHIHTSGILHRDLKTQNIFLSVDQNILKIGDFGISKVLTSKSKASTVIGTPNYISPERCEGKPYNKKSDIWALGCILYEMAALRQAFQAETIPALILKIMRGHTDPIDDQYSNAFKQLLGDMLHMDPNRRPNTNEIMAQPFLIGSIFNLYTDIGKVPFVARAPDSTLEATLQQNVQRLKEITKLDSDKLV